MMFRKLRIVLNSNVNFDHTCDQVLEWNRCERQLFWMSCFYDKGHPKSIWSKYCCCFLLLLRNVSLYLWPEKPSSWQMFLIVINEKGGPCGRSVFLAYLTYIDTVIALMVSVTVNAINIRLNNALLVLLLCCVSFMFKWLVKYSPNTLWFI